MELQLESMGHGPTQLQDMALGKKIMDMIERHFALHNWLVDINHEAGHGSIQLMYEGKNKETRVWKYGYLFHINRVIKMDELELEKYVMRCAGEVLERYGIARRKAKENDILDFLVGGDVDDHNMILESKY